ncbi:MAG TPA: hypothetical protein VHG93_02145 [Longimicrobium sp.]|nr:hypothetical protein [Longimicrobium sp.]
MPAEVVDERALLPEPLAAVRPLQRLVERGRLLQIQRHVSTDVANRQEQVLVDPHAWIVTVLHHEPDYVRDALHSLAAPAARTDHVSCHPAEFDIRTRDGIVPAAREKSQ